MAYARTYTVNEVKFSLQMFEGNRMFQGVVGGQVQRHSKPAHPALHGGASYLDQKARVTTPGEPRKTGTFLTKDEQAKATCEALNSTAGQTELAKFDAGTHTDVFIKAPLPGGTYKMALAKDDSDKGGGTGHVARADPARANATTTHTQTIATECWVKAMKGPGGSLQIQTSFPVAP